MSDDERHRLPPTIVTERERERAIRALGEHYAQDHLSIDEYEFRVQEALRATVWYQIAALTSDLPVLDPNATPQITGAAETSAPKRRTLVAIMGGVVRRGQWVVPQRLRAIAFMGGIEVDLRDAQFTAPVTEIRVLAVMGGVVVRVPPGVRLEAEGIAIMGGFEDQLKLPAVGHDAAPIVRVRGVAFMGGVETTVTPRGAAIDDDD